MSFLLGCWGWPWCWLLRGGHIGAGSVSHRKLVQHADDYLGMYNFLSLAIVIIYIYIIYIYIYILPTIVTNTDYTY